VNPHDRRIPALRAIGLIARLVALAAAQLGPTPAAANPGSILMFGPYWIPSPRTSRRWRRPRGTP
jgi:hypothetical protein